LGKEEAWLTCRCVQSSGLFVMCMVVLIVMMLVMVVVMVVVMMMMR